MTDPRTRRLRKRGAPDPKGVEYLAAFSVLWCRLLWDAMAKSGKGFPKVKAPRKQRADKANDTHTPKILRGVAIRGLVGGHKPTRPWVTPASRENGAELREIKREARRMRAKALGLGSQPRWGV